MKNQNRTHAFVKQLEFPFMMQVTPWDGQYTFTHYLAREAVRATNRELGPNPFWSEEKEVQWWKFTLDNYASLV